MLCMTGEFPTQSLLYLTDLDDNSEEGGGADESGSDRDAAEESDGWDEDKEWHQIQDSIREERKKKEAGMKQESYPTHSPFFPVVRAKA